MTELSLQRHNKNSQIQFRIEGDLKFIWNRFLIQNNLNQSELFRKWILAYMKKQGAIKIVNQCIETFDDVDEMPVHPIQKKIIEILI